MPKKTTNTTKSLLTIEQRAEVRKIVHDAMPKRARYNTRAAVASDESYRVKLLALQGATPGAVHWAVQGALDAAGYDSLIFQKKDDKSAIPDFVEVFVFGKKEPRAKVTKRKSVRSRGCKSPVKAVKARAKKVIVDNESLYGTGPGRSHTTNSGLPKGVKAADVKPGTVVEVWWRDAPVSKVLVTEVDRPTDKGGRVVSGEIDYRGIDEHGTAGQRFVSTQILGVVAEAEQSLSLLFGRIVGSDEVLAPRLLRVYRDMCDLAGSHADVPVITKGHRGGRGEVVVGDSSMDEVTAEEYQQMAKLPGIVERFVLIPGSAPVWLLSHKDNVHTYAHEVAIDYRNRPGQPIEL